MTDQSYQVMKRLAADYQNWSVGVMSQPVPGGTQEIRFVAILHRTHYSEPGFERNSTGRVTVGFILEDDSLEGLERQMHDVKSGG